MKNYLVITILIFLSSAVFGQVESSSTIRLINTVDSLRQVKGLSLPINDSSALNAHAFVSGKIYFGEASDSLIELDFYPDYVMLEKGMYFNLLFTSPNDSLLLLKIDLLSPVPILDYFSQPLKRGVIQTNEFVTVVYDGNNFILITPLSDQCPTGFTKINERYCIQTNENTATSLYAAILNCGNLNAELCGFTDWLNACNSSAGLMNMTDNFEWVNSASNNSNEFKVMGEDLNGDFGCDKSFTHVVSNINAYRCCYYLKK